MPTNNPYSNYINFTASTTQILPETPSSICGNNNHIGWDIGVQPNIRQCLKCGYLANGPTQGFIPFASSKETLPPPDWSQHPPEIEPPDYEPHFDEGYVDESLPDIEEEEEEEFPEEGN